MHTTDFDYHLPEECIAQRPAKPRDSSRLLVYKRDDDHVNHRIFHQLPDFLEANDVLVLNETRVIPARLKARKIPGGGRSEILLLHRLGEMTWEVMVGGRGLKPGRKLQILNGPQAEIREDLGGPRRIIVLSEAISPLLDRIGEMPLPPYIHTPLENQCEYQTTFARHPGSAAAPTAGLHFTPNTIASIENKGVRIVKVTLHVGLDTFVPVREDDPNEHPIHSEWCRVPLNVVQAIKAARETGGKVVAVGTTTVRALETAARINPEQGISPFEGPTSLYILPGFDFRVVDAMLTNFHLPRSTLLMMVSAFAVREQILQLYKMATNEGYRFYSFGDAMLIL
ncbi:MAG: tRNA preQ1(34) S-adenosylmethionine ribosyltransferase-isomerase QueA [Anaerolineales bacterium]|nr:tRNA preQ1(34) S-adenosylmethionine ribosyltransferase-isomerase QueA [Anaerolineales bacterium]